MKSVNPCSRGQQNNAAMQLNKQVNATVSKRRERKKNNKKWRPRDSFPFLSDKGNLHFAFKTRPPWRSTRLASLVEADRKGGRAFGWASPRKVKSQAGALTSGWARLHARHGSRRAVKPTFWPCNLEGCHNQAGAWAVWNTVREGETERGVVCMCVCVSRSCLPIFSLRHDIYSRTII